MITVDIAAPRHTAKKKERRIEKPLDAGHTISTLGISRPWFHARRLHAVVRQIRQGN